MQWIKKRIITIGFLLLLICNIIGINPVIADDFQDYVHMINTPKDYEKYGFKDHGYYYTPEALTQFYMPMVMKKNPYVDTVSKKDLTYKIPQEKMVNSKSYLSSNPVIDCKILDENNEYILILASMSCQASKKPFSIDFVPTIKGYDVSKFAWWNSSWSYRKEITINHSQVPESLEHFPVLISGSLLTDMGGDTQSDGGDIAFVWEDNTTQLYHEIERFATAPIPASVTFDIWVNVTRVYADKDTTIWMYYGNPTCADQYNNESTWNSGFEVVCHYNGDVLDSTSNNNDGTDHGTTSSAIAVAGKSRDFERNDNDYINYSQIGDFNEFTVELWHDFETMVDYELLLGNENDFRFLSYNNGDFRWKTGSTHISAGAGTYTTSGWYYTVGNADGTNIELFTNGVSQATGLNTANLNVPFWVGMEMDNGGSDYFDGKADELRISKVERNSSWIMATYNSITNNSDGGFFDMGPELEQANNAPLITTYSPSDGSTVYGTNINISVYIYDPEGDTFNYTIETSPDIGHKYGNNTNNGTKEVNDSGATYGTTYTVFVNTTDSGSGNWTNITYSFTVEGGLIIQCFNEANFSQEIGFDLLISNQDGTETYSQNDFESGDGINTTLMPSGDNTIFVISNSSYRTRVYYYDIDPTDYFNLTFYLPPIYNADTLQYAAEPVVNPSSDVVVDLICEPERVVLVQGWNESLYGHWFIIASDNYTLSDDTITVDSSVIDANTTLVQAQYYCSYNTLDYIIHVVDTIGAVVDDAKVRVQRLVNQSYENMSIMLTDGNGDATMYLIPDEHYRIILSKDGYTTSYADYIPSESVRTKTYQLSRTSSDTNASHWLHYINISAEMTYAGFLYLNYTDSLLNTTMVNVTVERWNGSSYNDTFYFYNDTADSFSVSTSVSIVYGYRVVFVVDHGDYDVFTYSVVLNSMNLSVTTASELEDMFNTVFGSSPFGWLNVIAVFILMAGLFSFGEAGAGLSLLGTGFVFLFLNVLIIGFVASTMVPILFVILGILVEWRHVRRRRSV